MSFIQSSRRLRWFKWTKINYDVKWFWMMNRYLCFSRTLQLRFALRVFFFRWFLSMYILTLSLFIFDIDFCLIRCIFCLFVVFWMIDVRTIFWFQNLFWQFDDFLIILCLFFSYIRRCVVFYFVFANRLHVDEFFFCYFWHLDLWNRIIMQHQNFWNFAFTKLNFAYIYIHLFILNVIHFDIFSILFSRHVYTFVYIFLTSSSFDAFAKLSKIEIMTSTRFFTTMKMF